MKYIRDFSPAARAAHRIKSAVENNKQWGQLNLYLSLDGGDNHLLWPVQQRRKLVSGKVISKLPALWVDTASCVQYCPVSPGSRFFIGWDPNWAKSMLKDFSAQAGKTVLRTPVLTLSRSDISTVLLAIPVPDTYRLDSKSKKFK